MKLLTKPATKVAKTVVSWKDIRKDAFDMLELLNHGKFPGKWTEGLALSHAQISEQPFNFFVTHKSWENVLPRVICNARIIQGTMPEMFKEACMSFPFRDEIKTKRFFRIDVEFDVPPIDGIRSVLPFADLKTEQRSLDGLVAFLFQHEIQHSQGKHIYQ